MEAYKNFKGTRWQEEINVNDFILQNYKEYTGDESFLQNPTEATIKLWEKLSTMFIEEKEKGIYDAETRIPSQIDAPATLPHSSTSFVPLYDLAQGMVPSSLQIKLFSLSKKDGWIIFHELSNHLPYC